MIKYFFAWLVRHPRLVDLVIRFAQRTPYRHIYSKDGSLYMGRWWLLKPRAWLPISIRIHHIARPDRERHLHDHPFDYRTAILRGAYVEENILGQAIYYAEGHTRKARAETFHRITKVSRDGAWTMFITSRELNPDWGYLVDGHKVERYQYAARFLKTAPDMEA